MKNILSLLLFISCLFWPFACKRVGTIELQPAVAQGDVAGRVILPTGTNWKADELTILSGFDAHTVQGSTFTMSSIDTTSYKLILATRANGSVALVAPYLAGNSSIEMSTASTALSLLLLHPVMASLNEHAKKALAAAFQKHASFPDLVKEIEKSTKEGKDLLEDNNVNIMTLLNVIQNSKLKFGGRRGGTQGIIGNEPVIKLTTTNPRSISIKNERSFLPYIARIYDSNNQLLSNGVLDLGDVSFGYTSAADLAIDAWNLAKESSSNFDGCLEDFYNSRSGTPPTTACGAVDFFKLQYPTVQNYTFQSQGKYTVKVTNAFSATSLTAPEVEKFLGKLVLNAVGVVNKGFQDYLTNGNCIQHLVVELINTGTWESIKLHFSQYNEASMGSTLLTIIKTINERIDNLECLSSNNSPKSGLTYLRNSFQFLLKFADLPGRFGAGANLLFTGKAILYDKYSYDYCVEVNSVGISLCGEDPETPIADATEPVSTAISTGDPHLTTPDKLTYSFMGVGEFIAVKSTTDRFEIQARQEEVKSKNSNGQVSFNTGIAIHTGHDEVCMYPPNHVFVNKQAIGFNFETYPLSNGGSITRKGSYLYVRNGNDDLVEVRLFNLDLDYYVTLNPNRQSKVRGILGNYDKNPSNDLFFNNGQPVANTYQTLYPAYADSWRIKQSESLFVYDPGKNTDSYTDRAFPRSPVSITTTQRANAEAVCRQNGITDPVLLQNCIMDVALTGDNQYAQRASAHQNATHELRSISIANFGTKQQQFFFKNATNSNPVSTSEVRVVGNTIEINAGLGGIYAIYTEPIKLITGFETTYRFTGGGSPFGFVISNRLNADTQTGRLVFSLQGNNVSASTLNPSLFVKSVLISKTFPNVVATQERTVKVKESTRTNGSHIVEIFVDNLSDPVYVAELGSSSQNYLGFESCYVGFLNVNGKVALKNWVFKAL